MNYLVTGGAGFIGSNLVDRLLSDGHRVVAYDNCSTGQLEFLAEAMKNDRFRLIKGDILDLPALTSAMQGADVVFHLAANADVRFGPDHPRKDLDQNTIGTFNVLEAMRSSDARRMAFSSTGSIYGEPEIFPTPEDAPLPVQTSLYGASKLAGEGLIQAYCSSFGFQACIFRFVSILGERYSHGHVFDFYKQLQAHPDRLDVLGNGKQRKSYLSVEDCIEAMLLAIANMAKSSSSVSIHNLGTNEYVEVDDSIGWICEYLGVSPERIYSGGERGWIGDSPFIFLDCSRIRSLGWQPKSSIRDGVTSTIQYLVQNQWLLNSRQ
jgi:UDP-glucose 4-epimerase